KTKTMSRTPSRLLFWSWFARRARSEWRKLFQVEVAMTGLANGSISFSIVRLANVAIRSMLMTKIKVTAATLLAVGITVIGIRSTAQQVDRAPKAPAGLGVTKPEVVQRAKPIDTPPD